MGLQTDIYNAFIKSMGGDKDLAKVQTDNVSTLSGDLTEAIKVFLTKQTWTITELKAFGEIEDIYTEEGIPVDVAPRTLLGPHGPAISALKSLGVDIESPIKKAAASVSRGGAESQPLKLEKTKGLKGTIHAYVGNPPEGPSLSEEFDTKGDSEGWNDFSKVKLNYNDIEEDD